jgi:hypothetical protein
MMKGRDSCDERLFDGGHHRVWQYWYRLMTKVSRLSNSLKMGIAGIDPDSDGPAFVSGWVSLRRLKAWKA